MTVLYTITVRYQGRNLHLYRYLKHRGGIILLFDSVGATLYVYQNYQNRLKYVDVITSNSYRSKCLNCILHILLLLVLLMMSDFAICVVS